LAIALGLLLPPVVAGAKKIKAYNAQTSYTFTNVEQAPAHGLIVVLSAEAEVMTDDETGAAERFRNVSGNGSSKITLTNATQPVDAAGGESSSVDLVFRSYRTKLQIKNWWWIDEKGKRVGKKQKG
jgi:hypothetical protein